MTKRKKTGEKKAPGRRPIGEKSRLLFVRAEESLSDGVEAYRSLLAAQSPSRHATLADAVRALLWLGLRSVGAPSEPRRTPVGPPSEPQKGP